MIAETGPAVVNIRTEQLVRRRSSPFFGFGDSFFDDFFSQFGSSRLYRTQSLGSGAIIDPRGYLLTNAHVVDKASRIYVALLGETQEREATLVGSDPALDLAVIKVETEQPLPSLRLGRSDDLLLGETVIAIGNPLGLENSVTTGVISAPRRRLPDGGGGLSIFIQTDALINPGNSGGPLINIEGKLIGINTAIAQQAQGIGFAIPINVAKRVAFDLINHGRVRPAYAGILAGEISRSMAKARGAGGALVNEVDLGSPAAKAGVQVADVILELDGVQIDTASEYTSLLRTYPPGSLLALKILRGTEVEQIQVQLSALPDGYALHYLDRFFGLTVDDSQRGVEVRAVRQGSAAARIEIRPGDLIAELEGEKISTLTDLTRLLEGQIGRLPLRFLVVRANRGYLLELP
ncbi:MAG: hypothetical protein C0614_13515 [Desulfuromonas sp.]|nr:MAG: hypothetical protein C0614_13515 [Desulfuromonas sp.]